MSSVENPNPAIPRANTPVATPGQAAAPPAGAAEPRAEERGLGGHVADVFLGIGQGGYDMLRGTVTMVVHPWRTFKGVVYAATHPGALVQAFVEPYSRAIKEGRPGLAIGRGVAEIGSFFVGGAIAKALGKGGKLGGATGKAGEVAVVADKAKGVLSYADRLARGAETVAGKAEALRLFAGTEAKMGMVAEAAKTVSRATMLSQYAETLRQAAVLATAGDAVAASTAIKAGMKIPGMVSAVKEASFVQKAGLLIDSAGKVGKATKVVGTASKVVAIEAKPSVVAAFKKAGIDINSKVSQEALAAARQAYQNASALGIKQATAKVDIAAEAAKVLGVAKDAEVADKIAKSFYLRGAANNPMFYAKRTNFVERPLARGAELLGGAVDKGIGQARNIGTYLAHPIESMKDAGRSLGGKYDALRGAGADGLARAGGLTLADLAGGIVRLPLKVAKGVYNVGNKVVRRGAKSVKGVAMFAAHHPKMTLAAGMANRLATDAMASSGKPGVDTGKPGVDMSKLSDEQVMAIARQSNLEPTRENVAKFLTEAQSYQGTAIGPDMGTPEQVKQLQEELRAYGYPIEPGGKFDENTAMAVKDFKQRKGITQT
ncbi:MAG: peptidoglycan-binding protein, partial [Cyanobacteria bacterium NC_groundwater_1444_Ag_S-0.65um_54_12]|nr:peptidoglycan-binding protein [Cyanobacteria bacterium NC_groundwater_1444_Ag_S-0.65um_54_12]